MVGQAGRTEGGIKPECKFGDARGGKTGGRARVEGRGGEGEGRVAKRRSPRLSPPRREFINL